MSLTTMIVLGGASGGAAWAGITLAATWWFNRRVRRVAEDTSCPSCSGHEGQHVYVPRRPTKAAVLRAKTRERNLV